LLASSEILEILDPPVLETGAFGFAELGSAEQTIALCIGQKPDCSVWQTKTSSFFRKPNFPRFDQKLDAFCTKSFVNVFSSLKICCTVKSLKRATVPSIDFEGGVEVVIHLSKTKEKRINISSIEQRQ
jgi:hypothetical protein